MYGIVMLFAVFLFQTGQDLYQQALVQERAAGNLQAAIELYQDAARNAAGDRALAVQALMGAARCYDKLGQTKAREIYDDVARNYADQAPQAAMARERAEALERHERLEGIHSVLEINGNQIYLRSTPSAAPSGGDRLVAVAPGMFWQSAVPQFSNGRPITVTGTVSRVEWANPSVNIQLDVTEGDGRYTTYRVFGTNPRRLLEDGLRRDFVKPGDLISVDGFLGDLPQTIGRALLALPDGRRIVFGESVSGATAPQQ